MKLFEKKYLLRSMHGQLWALLFFIDLQMTGEASVVFAFLALSWMVMGCAAFFTKEPA